MAEPFDPYHIWLGIPPAEQPADHYRLLGISRFESNLDVISNAADQRVRHIRGMQTGKRQGESQKLLNEIAAAAAVLLDPDRRREYDATLAVQRGAAAEPPVLPPPAIGHRANRPLAPPPVQAPRAPNPFVPQQASPPSLNPNLVRWFAFGSLAVGVVSVLLVVVVLVMRQWNNPQSDPANAVAQSTVTPGVHPAIHVASSATPAVAPAPPQPTVPFSQPGTVPAVSATPPPPTNPEHQKNWEYGYGRLDASGGKVVEFHPLSFSAERDAAGIKSVRWGVAPQYPAPGPLDVLHLQRVGGHTANDPSITVIRRWRYPGVVLVKVSGELEMVEGGGDGVRARLVTGKGKRIWEATVKGARSPIIAKDFVLQENETLDLCVDSNINHAYDTFKSRLHLDVRLPRANASREAWDSVADYREPIPPPESAIASAPTAAPAAPVPPTVTVEPKKVTRLPIPGEAALAAARAQLQETFGDIAAKGKKPEEKLKLLGDLRGVAGSEKDPAIRYALLDAARRLGMGAHDVRAALLAATEIARQYETDLLEQQLQTLKLATGTMPSAAWEEAAASALALADTSRDTGRIDVADAASLLALDFAAKGKNLEQRKQAKQVRDLVLAYKKSAALVQQAEETLSTKPDDPAANLVVGKWRCFVLDDWAKGLPCLERCGVPALVAAARAERDPKNSLAIADAWYAVAAKLSGTERTAATRRSHGFYVRAANESKGLDQLRAAKRAEELQDAAGQKTSGKTPASPAIPPTDEKLEPGLIVRIVSGSQAIPTPILGTNMNWDGIVWDNVEVESRKVLELRGISASPLATGYIELDTDDTVVFTLRNAYCLIDGANFPPLVAAQKGEDPSYFGGRIEAKFEKQLTKGRHTLVIGRIPINTGSGTEFKVKRKGGGDCLFHSPKELEAELAKTIRLPGGGVSKGILLFGNLRFSR